MERYALFIDADGTLINTRGLIPESAKKALRAVKENGNYIYLSTGRCLPEINHSILDIGFNGIIASGGAYVENNSKVLRKLIFDKSDVIELKEYFLNNSISVSFECSHCLYVSQVYMDTMFKMAELNGMLNDSEFYDFRNIMTVIKKDTEVYDVTKVSFMGSERQFYEIKNNFSMKYDIIDSSMSELTSALTHGEMALKDIHKASAMKLILSDLNEDVKTIALGDSENDVEMLKFADTGIAMGNASQICKSAADEITDHVNNDGLYKALKAHNLF